MESRLKELRAQVTQRQESEEKYVAAAMTIAELWADGIGITPPTPNPQPVGTSAPSLLPGPRISRPNATPVPNQTSPATFGTPIGIPGPPTLRAS